MFQQVRLLFSSLLSGRSGRGRLQDELSLPLFNLFSVLPDDLFIYILTEWVDAIIRLEIALCNKKLRRKYFRCLRTFPHILSTQFRMGNFYKCVIWNHWRSNPITSLVVDCHIDLICNVSALLSRSFPHLLTLKVTNKLRSPLCVVTLLTCFPSLKTLHLEGALLDCHFLPSEPSRSDLQELRLIDVKLDQLGRFCESLVSYCVSLRLLQVVGFPKDTVLWLLAHITTLEEVFFTYRAELERPFASRPRTRTRFVNPDVVLSVENLQENRNMKRLAISGSFEREVVLRFFKLCPCIEHLILNGERVSAQSI
jgi:hypothetical protein